MEWIFALIATAISAGLVFAGLFVIKKIASSSGGEQEKEMIDQIESLNQQIGDLLDGTGDRFSKKQLDTVAVLLREASTVLETQKNSLKQIETKLDQVQKGIEEKEAYHQSLKASKAEDEEKVTDILARFEDISTESIALEQKLAQSLKNLDIMMNEVEISQDGRVIVEELQNVLVSASSQLRELFLEYDSIKNRIDALNHQLEDLEEEYTRLVEQQLGEG